MTEKNEIAPALGLKDVEDAFSYNPPAVPMPEVQTFEKVARLGFKSDKGPSAAAIQQALGNVPPATPYVERTDGSYVTAAGCSLMQIAEFPYWAKRQWNGEYMEHLAVYTTEPSKDEKKRLGLDDCCLAVHIVLPGQSQVESHVVVGTWANATAKVPSILDREIAKSTTPEWVRANPVLGAAPPRRRVIGHLQTNMRKSARGFDYVTATVFVTPAGLPQIQAFSEKYDSPEGATEIKKALDKFETEVLALRKIAAKTS